MGKSDCPLFNLLPPAWLRNFCPSHPPSGIGDPTGGQMCKLLGLVSAHSYTADLPLFLLKTSQLIKVYNSKKSFDIVTIFYATKRGKKVFFLSQIFIYLSCSFLIFTIFMGDDHLVYNSTSTLESFPIPSASSGANCLTV